MLLCPGLGMSSDSWDTVAADLAADHTVIRYDRPGLAPGVPPRRQLPTLAGEAAQLVAALRWGGVSAPAVLVGHSMAGFLVEAVARCHPASVAGLVLVDSSIEPNAAGADPAARGWVTLAQAAGTLPLLGPRLAAATYEQAGYAGMATELRTLRASRALPAIPVHVQAAAWLNWWGSRRWIRRQWELCSVLAADHPDGPAGVSFEVISRCGHQVMRHRPDRICAEVRAMSSRPRAG